jgi:Ca-activated chloride channel family protein
MFVVNPTRAARRAFGRSILGQSALVLLVLTSACTPTLSSRDEPKTKLPTSAAEGQGPRALADKGSQAPRKDSNTPIELAPPEALLEQEPASAPPPAATAMPAPMAAVSRGTLARKAMAAPSSAAGGLGLSGVGAGGGGRGYGAGSGRLGGAHAMRFGVINLPGDEEGNTENYAHVAENKFLNVADQPLSTFSIDVDTASYSNARRFLNDGSLPPKDAIRVEEWLNYFGYDYPEPVAKEPFSLTSEVSACPWNASHRLLRLGLKSQQISQAETPARNLVFLVDVSGSMMPANKLPLLKRGLALLAENLRPKDTISIVVYAGASGLALPATKGSDRGRVLDALGRLEAGGSTNGGDGIRLAYETARQHFVKGGINRVILATDGDFNVGTSSEGELQRLIETERKSGVFLTVLGFGEGNVKDSTMEMLADKGNGNYAYIDSISEARKVLVREAGSTLITIAKDVKLQLEFNPTRVASYKLIGYENRLLAKEDFNDDQKDAGELGAGHAVTALYEVVPKGENAAPPKVDPLKYQTAPAIAPAAANNELCTVNIRYKQPSSDVSTRFSRVVVDNGLALDQTSPDFRFSAAVAEAALVLRGAPDLSGASLEAARTLAQGALGQDVTGDRHEFVSLLAKARALAPTAAVVARAK